MIAEDLAGILVFLRQAYAIFRDVGKLTKNRFSGYLPKLFRLNRLCSEDAATPVKSV
jgi:hypothetical protein